VARRCGQLVLVADGSIMGWFSRTTTEADMKGSLTADERIALTRLEAAVDAGVQASMTVLEAGKALSEIRSRQLYRDTAATWDEYVTTRFKITKRRCDQLIAFAGVKAAIDTTSAELGTVVPNLSERAIRPLVGLPSDEITEIVQEAAGSSEGVTAGTIRKVASRRKAKAAKVRRPVRFKVPGAVIVVTWNRKASGTITEALEAAIRQAQAEGQTKAA
jgi:hypothetical protein